MEKDDSGQLDMDQTYTFYDPHPGFKGAAIPIPKAIKAVADAMDGQTMTLREAVERLEAVGIGTIEVVTAYSYIALKLGSVAIREGESVPRHLFRVIRYR